MRAVSGGRRTASAPTQRVIGGTCWYPRPRDAREQGPDKLTMDAPAERAGLGKGTVFRRLGTRAGIFAALLDDDEKAFQQRSWPVPRRWAQARRRWTA